MIPSGHHVRASPVSPASPGSTTPLPRPPANPRLSSLVTGHRLPASRHRAKCPRQAQKTISENQSNQWATKHRAKGAPTSRLRPPVSGLRSPASRLRPPASGLPSPASGLPPPVSRAEGATRHSSLVTRHRPKRPRQAKKTISENQCNQWATIPRAAPPTFTIYHSPFTDHRAKRAPAAPSIVRKERPLFPQ